MMRGTGEGSQMMMESRVNFQKYAFESSQLWLLRARTTFGTSPHCTQRWTTSKQSCTYTQSWMCWNTALLKTEGVIISCHQTGNQLPLWVPVILLPKPFPHHIFWEMLSYHWSRWTARSSFSLLSSSSLWKTSNVSNGPVAILIATKGLDKPTSVILIRSWATPENPQNSFSVLWGRASMCLAVYLKHNSTFVGLQWQVRLKTEAVCGDRWESNLMLFKVTTKIRPIKLKSLIKLGNFLS